MSSQAPTLPEPGSTLAGRYVLGRQLGKGAMGVVFEAELKRLEQRVAIKVLRPEILQEPALVARFEREARLIAKLNSKYIVRVLDVDTTESGLPFLVMEYLDGHDLAAELRARGPFALPYALETVRQLASGVEEAHRAGVIHRDLKPSNVFLVKNDEPGGSPDAQIVKIVDFGVSKLMGQDTDMTATASTLGTPRYMSPEQIRSAKSVDERSDVWAISTILFELITGRTPFTGESATGVAAAIVTEEPFAVRALRPDVSEGIEQVIHAGLIKNPDRRIPTASAFRAAIEQCATDLQRRMPMITAAPQGLPTQPAVHHAPPAQAAHAAPTPHLYAFQTHQAPASPAFGSAPPASSPQWAQAPAPPQTEPSQGAGWPPRQPSPPVQQIAPFAPTSEHRGIDPISAHGATPPRTQDSWSQPPPHAVALRRKPLTAIVASVIGIAAVVLIAALLFGRTSGRSNTAANQAPPPHDTASGLAPPIARTADAPRSDPVLSAPPSLSATSTAVASAPPIVTSVAVAPPTHNEPHVPQEPPKPPPAATPKDCAPSMKILIGGKLVCP